MDSRLRGNDATESSGSPQFQFFRTLAGGNPCQRRPQVPTWSYQCGYRLRGNDATAGLPELGALPTAGFTLKNEAHPYRITPQPSHLCKLAKESLQRAGQDEDRGNAGFAVGAKTVPRSLHQRFFGGDGRTSGIVQFANVLGTAL